MVLRFHGTLTNCELFVKLVQTMDKIGKRCVLRVTPDNVTFIFTGGAAGDDLTVWCGIGSVAVLFDDYEVSTNDDNEIGLEVFLDNLLRALKSAMLAHGSVKMVLTKHDDEPVLRFKIVTGRTPGQQRFIYQDVPVRVLTPALVAEFSEPILADPTVYILLPPLKLLRGVIDRMKNMSDYLTIEADMAGNLTLAVRTLQVSVSTVYENLESPRIEGKQPPVRDASVKVAVRVAIKKFAKVLYSYQVEPLNVILCVVEDTAVVVHVLLDGIYITYYVPVILGDANPGL